MFTGIIEEVGRVRSLQKQERGQRIEISCQKIMEDISLGDSVAVNGICLTVSQLKRQSFTADVMQETLDRTSFAQLKNGDPVNLERAMAAQGRFGGHIVSGHIDGVGQIQQIRPDGIAKWYTIQAPPNLLRYVVEKGSIALDGISLTVAEVREDSFSVSIIPHTQAQTNLSVKKIGDLLNIEVDLVGKYIEKFLRPDQPKESQINEAFLNKFGYIN